jgi:glycosyltransferase involved in cell wall biosynthesis
VVVPSVYPECFGRVAAEALVNGIPALVSDRGALPETVADGGRVIPLPASLSAATTALPDADAIEPWFDAVCELWDDSAKYAEASRRARATAERLYSESVLRQRYLDFFASLNRHEPLFV